MNRHIRHKLKTIHLIFAATWPGERVSMVSAEHLKRGTAIVNIAFCAVAHFADWTPKV